ncbi:50S ribosomal protein L10 [Leucoagaricus sp. SymC.cos]|nr:50S ribosomal protein L10 [Leucoagaricus sp. SymC.cos]KXN85708.1 50S ribosomal protein L10 [Leucoagaricus sp. SymC.cos]KXN85709.1 50S ribosomal protein L10 [Leucoagaricus sp. SymC.cos]
MLALKSGNQCRCWLAQRFPSSIRTYAISLDSPQRLPGKKYPRVFKDKKAYQYSWYTSLLKTNTNSPILFLQHEDFTVERLRKLRLDINTAAQRVVPSLTGPTPDVPAPLPTLTVVRTSILGAVLRDLPGVNRSSVKRMLKDTKGSFALLSFPNFHPPQLKAALRAMEKSVPSKPPKTPEELAQELSEKNADPVTPGRRMKRVRQIRTPELKLVGALVEGKVFLKEGVDGVSKLPTLETLQAQLVGLLGSPASQLAAILGQASGGALARTLEGFKKGLEEEGQQAS